MPHLLEVRDLKTHFHTPGGGLVRAVDGVSFNLNRGETLGIVGESGSGKSVASLSIMQLLPKPAGFVAGGEIRLEGRDLLAMSEREMRQVRSKEIAMIFQDPMTSLNPVVPVGRQIIEPLKLHLKMSHRQARDRVIELMALVGIPEPQQRIEDYPHQFSGGMRQRMLIAIALTCNPKILIADEPTTALDVTVQAQILDLIVDLQKQTGMAVILISHDLGVIAETCNQVAVMYRGKVIEAADAQDLFAAMRHPYTRGLLDSIPVADEEVEHLNAVKGRVPMLEEVIQGCAFNPRCPNVQQKCIDAIPPAADFANGHQVRCHFPLEAIR